MTKLTKEQAQAIVGDTRIPREIAEEYGVSAKTVRDIKTGRRFWKDLDRPRPANLTDRPPGTRAPRNAPYGNGKLTEEQVRAIIADPRSQKAIAEEYGVSEPNVWAIRTGKSWKYLERPEPKPRAGLRANSGENHARAKLTEEQAKAIIPDPRKYKVIAEAYGVSASVVGQIKAGFLWKHLDRSNVVRRSRGADAPVRKIKSPDDSR